MLFLHNFCVLFIMLQYTLQTSEQQEYGDSHIEEYAMVHI